MTAHLVRLAPGRCGQTTNDNTDSFIVWVADASATKVADARAAAAAASKLPKGIWADAQVTELSQANLATAIPGKTVN